MTTVAACIPSIPPRLSQLRNALDSVLAQTRPVDEIAVAFDVDADGAWRTRNRALGMARAEWVAFLDDDDLWLPQHIERLLAHQADTGADVVYPWFAIEGGGDPLGWEGKAFDPDALRDANYIPVTLLVRRALLLDVGGFPRPSSPDWWHESCEDWGCWLRLLDAGATFSHLPERTWIWRHHGANLSGRPWKDAA